MNQKVSHWFSGTELLFTKILLELLSSFSGFVDVKLVMDISRRFSKLLEEKSPTGAVLTRSLAETLFFFLVRCVIKNFFSCKFRALLGTMFASSSEAI